MVVRLLRLCTVVAFLLVAGSLFAGERPGIIGRAIAVTPADGVAIADPSFDFPRPAQDQSRPTPGVIVNIDCGVCRNWSHCNERYSPALCEYSPYLTYCTVPSTGPPPCEACYDSGPCWAT
ncbi:MAG: hypothetical protein ACLGH0_15765 [Thermoanaerobaculia bacterium]